MNPDIDPEIGNKTSIINLSCRFNTLFRAGTKQLRICRFQKLKKKFFDLEHDFSEFICSRTKTFFTLDN